MKQPFFSIKRNVVFIAVLYTFLWGCAFPLVKICMSSFNISDSDNVTKCLVAGIRFTLSGLITLIWYFGKEKSNAILNKKELGYVVLYGVLATCLQYSFTYIGLSRIDGSKGAVFDQLCVFFVILLSGLFFKNDKLTLFKIIGCILGLTGVIAINANGISFDFALNGEGIMLCAVVCQTASYFIAKKSSANISAIKLVGYGQLIGGLLLTVLALAMGGSIATVNESAILTLLLLSLISSLAYVLSLMPLQYFPASEVSSFNLLITIFGVIMSAVFLKENIWRWNYGVSLLLISLGILFVNKKRITGGNYYVERI